MYARRTEEPLIKVLPAPNGPPSEANTFLITGGSRGIGRAVALSLADRGAMVALHYARDEEAATQVVSEISRRGGRAFPVRADLSSPDAPDAIVASVRTGLADHDAEPALDGIVLCAGELVLGDLEHLTIDDFDRAVAVNVRAPLFLVKAALPLLPPGARIITVSAVIARLAEPVLLAQAAAKVALQSVSRSLAATLGSRGITVVDVAPGVVRTDLAAPWLAEPDYVAEVSAATALGRASEPEDVAEAIVALLDSATHWITGESIEVSGGYRL